MLVDFDVAQPLGLCCWLHIEGLRRLARAGVSEGSRAWQLARRDPSKQPVQTLHAVAESAAGDMRSRFQPCTATPGDQVARVADS